MASADLETLGQGGDMYFAPVKYRNMRVQVLLMLVTIGMYGIYWFYSTATDMANKMRREEPTVLWTILLFVPLISFYAYYKYSELFEKISPDMNKWILLLLWTFFPPAVWALVQIKLNKIALSSNSLA
ncbi:MAG: DUF4234 domain-containing protein [Bdellovibrionia bacterium]